MINSKKLGSAFALGVEVATGTIVEVPEPEKKNKGGPREWKRKKGVHTEAFARKWIDDHVLMAEAHPTSDDLAEPGELRAALEAAYEAGKASKIAVPVPQVLPPLAGEKLARLIAEGKL